MILVISPKNVYFVQRFIEECKSKAVEYEILDVQDLINCNFKINFNKYSVVYIRYVYFQQNTDYLLRVIQLAKDFKALGKRVVDENIAEGLIDEGKWVDYNRLEIAEVDIPKTNVLNRKTIPEKWPFILKWMYGLKAKNVYFINNQKRFEEVFKLYPKNELLVQEFIPAEYEYKVITVGFKSLPVVLRFNIATSGFKVDFKNYEVLKSEDAGYVVKLAEKATKVLGRELAKVDILESNGKFYVLEVNRFPGLDSFEKLTKYNAVKDFLAYLV